MKKCRKCNIEREFSEFGKRKEGKNGLQSMCKCCKNEYHQKWKKDNKESVKETNKKSRNTIERKEYLKKWNDEKGREYYNNRNKEKRKTEPLFKLKANIRTGILTSFRRNGFSKKSKTEEILGCSFDFFIRYIQDKFEHWMTWHNQGNPEDGILELNKSWDIDHIIPVSSATTEKELIELNHYTNLQPLCSYENRIIKRDKIK